MKMKPGLRRFALMAHITCAIGWLGSVIPYLALAVVALTSDAPELAGAVYRVLPLIGWYVIVPFSIATIATGVVQALGTEWGLFRHYWVLIKFVLTLSATTILLLHMPVVSRLAAIAAEEALTSADYRQQRIQLVVHAAGGLIVLMTSTVLSTYKPFGLTPYGRRRMMVGGHESTSLVPAHSEYSQARKHTHFLRWPVLVLALVVILLLIVLAFHLASSNVAHHR